MIAIRLLRPIVLAAVASWLLSAATVRADEPDLPRPVVATLDEVAPGWTITEFEKEEEDDGVRYEIHLRTPEGRLELKVTGDGTVLEIEFEGAEQDRDREPGEGGDEDDDDRDSDGDHFPDAFERRHHGDPGDARRIPQLLEVRVTQNAEGPALELSVATAAGMILQIEHCPAGGTWEPFGNPIAGDGKPFVVIVPQEGVRENGCGLFRVRVLANRLDPGDGTGGDGTDPEPCQAPATLAGRRLLVTDSGDSRTLDLQSATTGVILESRTDGEVVFTPFSYRYDKIAECLGRLTLVFPSVGGGDSETLYLAFESDATGAVIVEEDRDLDDDDDEFERAGRFQLATR